ncbi:phospholipid phosphatase-related protein type 1-like isoform X1 [Tachypleus tridentatus]|uniref:phospholipid phosphatase-related protein type 1-like isoform X1 n=1 Tax=Tachypleus tridentatus TaxID=6853 RepID=UPI003FCF6DC4
MYSGSHSPRGQTANYEEIHKLGENILEPIQGDDESESSDDDKVYEVNLNIIPVFILEVLVLGGIAALAYFLRFEPSFPVLLRGFVCNDETIIYPKSVLSQNSTVTLEISPTLLYAVSLALPVTLLLLGELGYFIFSSKIRKVVRPGCVGCKMHMVFRRLIRFNGTFFFGYLCTSILTDALKLTTGQLRPHFLEVCNPSSCPPGQFISVDICRSPQQELRLARMSFPSFYASISSYSAVFIMVYLHTIVALRTSRLLRPTLVLSIAGLSLLCGVSRVSLHENHWADVIAGFLLGGAVGGYISSISLECFREHHQVKQRKCCNHKGRFAFQPGPTQRPLFYRYFRIPHVTYKNKQGKYFPASERESLEYSPRGAIRNEAFQKDLHQRVENYGKRHKEKTQN